MLRPCLELSLLRGHAASDKPPNLESYNNSKVWASDIDAVIKAKSLKRPLIVGRSYGGLASDVYSASL